MSRPRSKEELQNAAVENYTKLMDFIDSMSEADLSHPFDFSNDPKKTESHWGRDKNLRDVLVHLYEWQQLMVRFVENNRDSQIVFHFLPEEYSWQTYKFMNIRFWEDHQQTTLETAKELLAETHRKMLKMIEGYTNEELFTKKYYKWVGTTDLGSYFVSVTSSHYDWALKKLKAHVKNGKMGK